MANYATLKSAIQSVIKTNGNEEITGALLQQSLLSMINSLGEGFQFIGIATPQTNPGTPDQRVFYIGSSGTYPNFGPAIVPAGNLGIFYYDTSWHYGTIEFPMGTISEANISQSLSDKLFAYGYKYMGVATTNTNPGTPNQNVFYLAAPGTYQYFNNLIVPSGYIGVLKYSNSWSVETVPIGGNYDDAIEDLRKCLIYSKSTPTLVDVAGGIKYEDGTIEQGSFSHSSPIAVQKGDVIYLTSRCNVALAAIASTNASGTQFTPKVRGNTPDDPGLYIWVCDESGYVSFTYRADLEHSAVIYRSGLANSIAQNDGDGSVADLENLLIYSKTNAKYNTLSGGVKYEDGTIEQGSFSHSSPIAVQKGDVIYLTSRCNVALAAIASTNASGTQFTPKVRGNTPDDPGQYIWVCDETGYISISYRADYTNTVVIYRSGLINTIAANGGGSGGDGQQTVENSIAISNSHIDKTKTYLTISVPSNNFTFSIAGLYPVTKIEWGDGDITTPNSSADMSHVYKTTGVYTIALKGLTAIPNGSTTANALYDRDEVIGIYIGSELQSIANLGIYIDKNLKEVNFISSNIPTLETANAIQLSGGYPLDVIVPDNMFARWMIQYTSLFHSQYITGQLKNESGTIIGNQLVVTVGSNGDFQNLNDALLFVSTFYPTYKQTLSDSDRLKVDIQILNGTVISEQILVSSIDLSYITITSENYTPPVVTDAILEDLADGTIVPGVTSGWGVVEVDASGFGNVSHDSRGYKPLFRGENCGQLPQIGCIFKAINGGATAVGYFCNRSSSGVVKPLCGFIGFGAGCISNNESSITIREGIAMNCTDWGVHARHNGEISARSAILTNCGLAASADRIADLDIRRAYLNGSTKFCEAFNLSRINANGCVIDGGGASGTWTIQATYGGMINFVEGEINNVLGNLFLCQQGSFIYTTGIIITNFSGTVNSKQVNIFDENGAIFNTN